MSTLHPEVDTFLRTTKQWQDELAELRSVVLETALLEEWKWRQPCYTFEGNNVVILGGFKDHCVLSFFKGALLKDPKGILEKPGENTRAARVVPFTSVAEVKKLAKVLRAYIAEAIEIEKAGLKVDFEEGREVELPAELVAVMDERADFEKAFNALTPGRQRAYLLHFNSAKQSATRTARIEKCMPRIFDGKGLNDCTCGLSKKMPGCDGSHKSLG
jgi:uncharacterized protein YdeI (YjbR/CyaY-like superfamily)